MSRRRLFSLANESISFQSGRLGREIELAINIYIESKDKDNLFKQLSRIIKDHTNLTVLVRLPTREEAKDLGLLPAAIPCKEFSLGHILINDYNKKRLTDVFKNVDANGVHELQKKFEKHLESTVDLRTAKVTGFFEELECEIILEPDIFLNDFKITSPELTAIILHEIGHLFTCFEFANRLNKTNQSLALMSKLLMEKSSIDVMSYNFRYLGEKLTNNPKVFDGLENIKDSTVLSTVIVDAIVRHSDSELGLSHYDKTTSEYLADQFASRQGYGKEIITGLSKVFTKISGPNFSSNNDKALDTIFVVQLTGMTIFNLVSLGGILASLILIPFLMLLVGVNSYSSKDYTYDTFRTRFLRIKEQLVERIKDRKLDNKAAKDILDDLKVIDDQLSSVKDYESVFTKISLFFSKKNRDIKDGIQLQRDLEELSSNDLFIKSAKLKLI